MLANSSKVYRRSQLAQFRAEPAATGTFRGAPRRGRGGCAGKKRGRASRAAPRSTPARMHAHTCARRGTHWHALACTGTHSPCLNVQHFVNIRNRLQALLFLRGGKEGGPEVHFAAGGAKRRVERNSNSNGNTNSSNDNNIDTITVLHNNIVVIVIVVVSTRRYAFKSGSVVELLKGLESKFKDEQTEVVKAETRCDYMAILLYVCVTVTVHLSPYVYIYIYIHMYMYMYVCMYVCMYTIYIYI